MLTLCWAAKGGSGTTVVAASMALASTTRTLLVDLDGDIPAVLGLPEPSGPGVHDWLGSSAPADRLDDLTIAVTDRVAVLPSGRPASVAPERWPALVDWLRGRPEHVLVDAGTAHDPCPPLADAADRTLLVTRTCYLAMRDAARLERRPSAVVVVSEPGRRVGPDDVAAAVDAPLAAFLLLDPKVARAADAGLLVGSLPHAVRRALREIS
jgi:hypothetical protein